MVNNGSKFYMKIIEFIINMHDMIIYLKISSQNGNILFFFSTMK